MIHSTPIHEGLASGLLLCEPRILIGVVVRPDPSHAEASVTVVVVHAGLVLEDRAPAHEEVLTDPGEISADRQGILGVDGRGVSLVGVGADRIRAHRVHRVHRAHEQGGWDLPRCARARGGCWRRRRGGWRGGAAALANTLSNRVGT